MKTATTSISLILLLVTACGRPDEEVCAEKLAKLDLLRREAVANIARQQGECRAVAIEFPGGADVTRNCLETLQTMSSIARQTDANIDKRLSEPDMQRCADLLGGINPGSGPAFRAH